MAVLINGETKYEGQVVGTGSWYVGDGDSDYWALVFDGEKAEHVVYNRYFNTDNMAEADIDPAMLTKLAELTRPKLADKFFADAMARMAPVVVGSTVEVIRGRKIPVGTVGKVGWMGADRYSRWGTRIGLVVDGTMTFTDAGNVAKVRDEEAESDACLSAWARVVAMSDADVVRMYYNVSIR